VPADIQDRVHLTDYERTQLIPWLKTRLIALCEYFEDIINICDQHMESELFLDNVAKAINPSNVLPAEGTLENPAKDYFKVVRKQAKEENVDDINRILEAYSEIDDINKLNLFLNEINLLCSSLVAVKNRLFLSKLDVYPHLTNLRTGEIGTHIPAHYYLTIEPFQISIGNIVSICEATSQSVHKWHEETLQIKARNFELMSSRNTLRNNRLILWIQIFSIFLAISLSSLFMTGADPLNLFKENKELNAENGRLLKENLLLKSTQFVDGQNRTEGEN